MGKAKIEGEVVATTHHKDEVLHKVHNRRLHLLPTNKAVVAKVDAVVVQGEVHLTIPISHVTIVISKGITFEIALRSKRLIRSLLHL